MRRSFPALRRAAAFAAVLVSVCVAAGATCAHAQGPPSPERPAVLAALEGTWTGSGTLLGRPAEFSMRWEIGSEGFVRLTFSNAFVGEGGTRTPVLTAEAIYLPSGQDAVGVWLDDRPQRVTLAAVLTDSTVVTEWTAEAERGRTEYVVRSATEVVVRDFVYVDGSERRFGEATYRRAGPGPD